MEKVIKYLIIAIALSILAVPAWASPRGEVKKANTLFKKGEYAKAVDYYADALKKKNSALIEYNLGTALYKSGDYNEAVGHLRKALAAKEPTLKTAPNYNLGNAFYKMGKANEQPNLDQAVQNMEDAQANFKSVLDVDSKDKDAKFNYDLVTKELERLKKEQKKKKQQQKPSGGGSKDKEDKEDKNKEGGDKQDKNKQGQGDQQKNDAQQQQKDNSGGQQDKSGQQQEKKEEQQKADKQQGSQKDAGQKSQQPQQQGQAQDMTAQEAKEVLEDYQNNQEPKGLLNFIPKQKSDDHPVAKDW